VDPAVSRRANARRRLHIVFLVRSFGFPEGMAATNRVRLLGRALIEQGADVSVVCTRVSERPGEVRNRDPRGSRDGISYLYTPGATVRSDSFVVRRLREAFGYARALFELARLQRTSGLDCAYFADAPETLRPSVWLLRHWLGVLKVPVVTEFNELPGEIRWLPGPLSRRLSHLDGVRGAIAISSWLSEWTQTEAARLRRRVPVIEVPIVVDTGEQDASPSADEPATFVYSASQGFTNALPFIFRVMPHVWHSHPDCRLTVTGVQRDRAAEIADEEGLRPALEDGRVTITGYVSRRQLLEHYHDATALLIPLFDDLYSRARFPSKMAEYLASGRPVVTADVGEVARYFRDGETAYVAPPDDVTAYAAKIGEVLEDGARAARIGAAGRRLAEQQFDYKLQGPLLYAFLETIARQSAT
jgi:glycosyltransferase involved in cell wall biosynthesis